MGWLRSGGVYLASLVVGIFFGYSLLSLLNITSTPAMIGSGGLTVILVYYTRNKPTIYDLKRLPWQWIGLTLSIAILLGAGGFLLLNDDTGPIEGRAYYVYSDNNVPPRRFGYYNFTAQKNFTISWKADHAVEISLWRTEEFLNATRNQTDADYLVRVTDPGGNITISPENLTRFTVGIYNPFTVPNHVELEVYRTNTSAPVRN
ncbi:MAG: hypothetical protein SV186_04500 [Candidatus Nanohaloarchaea archaeon]|nr:hypothetical protein [Candidatus Nanohaloarchaea archaeon]